MLMTIADLIATSHNDDPLVAGPAAHEILRRSADCIPHIDAVVANLDYGNAAIEDFAFRTLERIGSPVAPAIVSRLENATGRLRMYLISLLPIVADFDTYFPLLERELNAADDDRRFHAANCLGRSYNDGQDWPPVAMETLRQAVDLLRTARREELRNQYWSQARMTLNHLGLIPHSAT
jgi:hypothetical protein